MSLTAGRGRVETPGRRFKGGQMRLTLADVRKLVAETEGLPADTAVDLLTDMQSLPDRWALFVSETTERGGGPRTFAVGHPAVLAAAGIDAEAGYE